MCLRGAHLLLIYVFRASHQLQLLVRRAFFSVFCATRAVSVYRHTRHQVLKRTGLRPAAPAVAAPAQNAAGGTRRLKFNVSKPNPEKALAATKDTPVLATQTRARQTSLAAFAHKTNGGAVASPYWKAETATAKDEKEDADRPAVRSLRSRSHNA